MPLCPGSSRQDRSHPEDRRLAIAANLDYVPLVRNIRHPIPRLNVCVRWEHQQVRRHDWLFTRGAVGDALRFHDESAPLVRQVVRPRRLLCPQVRQIRRRWPLDPA